MIFLRWQRKVSRLAGVAMLGMLLLKRGTQDRSRGSAIIRRGLGAILHSFMGSRPRFFHGWGLPSWVPGLNMDIPFQVALWIVLENFKIGGKCKLLPPCNPHISCLMCTFMASQNTHDEDIDNSHPQQF